VVSCSTLLETSEACYEKKKIGMLFLTVFVVVFMIILPDVDLMLFITFIASCKTSSIEIWFVLAGGLAENLTHVVFHQPFVIQHVRT